MRLGKKIKRAHLIITDSLFENSQIAFERQLAVSGIAKNFTREQQPRRVPEDTCEMRRQTIPDFIGRRRTICVVSEVTIFQTADLLIERLENTGEDGARAFYCRSTHAAKGGGVFNNGRTCVSGRKVASTAD